MAIGTIIRLLGVPKMYFFRFFSQLLLLMIYKHRVSSQFRGLKDYAFKLQFSGAWTQKWVCSMLEAKQASDLNGPSLSCSLLVSVKVHFIRQKI